MTGSFRINGKEVVLTFAGGERLLDVLRDNGFDEVKAGCHEGECGACLVVLDGKPVNSCQVLAGSAVGKDIITVKGIGTIMNPHPIQQAFVEAGAVQCGFCTPGMVMSTWFLLKHNPDPDDDEIKKALEGNFCRCTGYEKIIEAVKLAAEMVNSNEYI